MVIRLAVLLTLLGMVLMVFPTSAQTEVTITPSQVTIVATQGDTPTTRILLIQSTKTLSNLRLIIPEITTADYQSTLPISAITLPPITPLLTANTPLTLPLQIDVTAVDSGVYQSELQLQHDGGHQIIPLIISVKDWWLWPLLIMVGGVALGLAVSIYRVQGKPRDELLIRLGQLQRSVQADAELPLSFTSEINHQVVEVEANLAVQAWPKATTALEQAETIWLTWRKDRTNWITQLGKIDELLNSEVMQQPSAQCLVQLSRRLADAQRDAPLLPDGPRTLNEILTETTDQLNRYVALKQTLNQLPDQYPMSDENYRYWQRYYQQLEQLSPTDNSGFETLQGDIDTFAERLDSAPESTSEMMAPNALFGIRGGETMPRPVFNAVPTLRVGSIPLTESQQAQWRLTIFQWVGYGITIILLVGLGFNELYGNNPTFGAQGMNDYLPLLAWGFGAEASRNAITEVLATLDLPGLKQPT